jgi:hypothetical protein
MAFVMLVHPSRLLSITRLQHYMCVKEVGGSLIPAQVGSLRPGLFWTVAVQKPASPGHGGSFDASGGSLVGAA